MEVPQDAAAVIGGGDALAIVAENGDGVDGGLVLFHRCLHDLAGGANPPDADLAVGATGDDALVGTIGANGSHTSVVATHALHAGELVSVVDDVDELARLGAEGADFAVAPAGEDALAVLGEADAVALQSAYLDAEELSGGPAIPNADVVAATSGEQLAVAGGEDDVVNAVVVASLTELFLEGVSVEVVNVGLVGADEVVLAQSGDGGDGSLDFHLLDDVKVDLAKEGYLATARTDENIAISVQSGAQNTIGELLHGTRHLVVLGTLELDADDVAGGGADVGIEITRFDDDAAELATNSAEVDIGGVDLAIGEVYIPHTEHAVSSGDKLVTRVVEEGEAQAKLVGGRTTTKGTTGVQVPNDESVVILTTDGGEVLLIGAEGEGLDLDLVEHHAVDQLLGGELEDADIRLETHVGDLPTGDVLTALANGKAADLVVVASEEGGGTRVADLSDDDARAQGVEEVLAIGVDVEARRDLTAEANSGLEGEVGSGVRCSHSRRLGSNRQNKRRREGNQTCHTS